MDEQMNKVMPISYPANTPSPPNIIGGGGIKTCVCKLCYHNVNAINMYENSVVDI